MAATFLSPEFHGVSSLSLSVCSVLSHFSLMLSSLQLLVRWPVNPHDGFGLSLCDLPVWLINFISLSLEMLF